MAAAPPPPAAYQDLFNTLYSDLTTFDNTIKASWNGSRYPVAYTAQLGSANSNQLNTSTINYSSVLLELDGLKALGAQAIALEINFPVLYPAFYSSTAAYQQDLAFYKQVVQDIRARGMKVVVNTAAIFTTGGFSTLNVAPFYASLTLDQYRQGRANLCVNLAQNLNPDYLTVIQEPDTEAQQTGFSDVGTVDGSTALLNTILSSLQAAGVHGVMVGAGVGTWISSYLSYIQNFAATPIDYVDMHIYPVNNDYLTRALAIADTARSYGKRVAMSETWLYKVRDSEVGVLGFDVIYSRDAFSFWAPLDALHLRTMGDLANYKQFDFFSAFWSGLFRSYLDYSDSLAAQPPSALMAMAQSAEAQAMMSGVFTSTGIAYLNQSLGGSDVTPPSAPPGLTAQVISSSSIGVTWNAAPDNVGTARYSLYRGGTLLNSSVIIGYTDTGLSDGKTYTYSVVAIDASGNTSSVAKVSATTPDKTPPSVPGNVRATASISGSQVNTSVAWSASTDNVGVTSYKVYRGTSPTSLSVVGTTAATTFTVANVQPVTTYYFAVMGCDAAYNSSAQSAAAAVVTPSIPDITPPVANITNPKASSTVSKSTYLYASAYDVKGGTYDTPSGVKSLQFKIDGAAFGALQTVPYSSTSQYSVYRVTFDTRTLVNGNHAATAVVCDKAGNCATSPAISFTVSN